MKQTTKYIVSVNGDPDQILKYICHTKSGYLYMQQGVINPLYTFTNPLSDHVGETITVNNISFYIISQLINR